MTHEDPRAKAEAEADSYWAAAKAATEAGAPMPKAPRVWGRIPTLGEWLDSFTPLPRQAGRR